MLVPAFNYAEELKKKMLATWFDEKYKYYNFNTYYFDLKIDDETWNKHQFVSVDKEGNIIGYIKYNVNRQTCNCNNLSVINFTDNKFVFGMDLGQALTDIFERFKFRKLTFSVIIGNPIEKSYDKMINKYGGRIVGIYRQEVKLIDGEYYDEKLYEITRDDYLKSVNDSNKDE